MKKFPDFWQVIFGNGHVGTFLGFLVIGYLAALASVLIEVSRRDPYNKLTPDRFSWRFLLAANMARVAANIILVGLFIRLVYEYVVPSWMIVLAIGIGFGVDRLALLAKKIGWFTTDKIAAEVKDKLDNSSPKI